MALPLSGKRSITRWLALGITAIIALCTAASTAHAARITGVVYDSNTGKPLTGVPVQLFYDAADPIDPNLIVPSDRLGSNQQGQLTSAGTYSFDVDSGRRYRLHIPVAATPYAFPSARIPARPGFARTDVNGQVVSSTTPSAADRSYYLRFDIETDNTNVVNNHVPVDPLAIAVQLDKRVSRHTASAGDILLYKVTAKNRSNRDLTGAQNRAVYILDAPGRGLSYVRNRSVARVGKAGAMRTLRVVTDFGDKRESARSRRLIRFGPFDLAAGETLELTYQVVVGVDGRPGRYKNVAVLTDAAGVKLSNRSTATVNVRPDGTLHTGAVLGRVFCDADGDGRFDPGEKGFAGARVYLDTGRYAVTDSAGFYHFSRVPGGTHLVKVDPGSLAGGTLTSRSSRLLRLSMGLSGKANFGARCTTVAVRPEGKHGRVVVKTGKRPDKKPAKKTATLTLGTNPLSLTLGANVVLLPTANIKLMAPKALQIGGKDNNLAPVPGGGWNAVLWWKASVLLPVGVNASSWKFVIARADGTPVRTMYGAGSPPKRMAWNGLGDDSNPVASDTIYTAQLVVDGDKDSVRVRSPLQAFAIAFGSRSTKPTEMIWRGKLFAGTSRKPVVTADLRAKLAKLVKGLPKTAKILIESHSDGRGGKLAQIARTQREAKLVEDVLVKAGIAERNITVRGRGAIEQLEPPRTAKARAKNRRLVIVVSGAASPNAGKPIVVAPSPSFYKIDGKGKTATGYKRLRFSTEVGRPGGGSAIVELQAPSGRYARMAVDVPNAPGAAPAPRPPPVEQQRYLLQLDLNSRSIRVVGKPQPYRYALPFELLQVKASLVRPVNTRGRGRRRRLTAPLAFNTSVPAAVKLKSWDLTIMDARQNVVHSQSGTSILPREVSWDGRDEGRLVLRSGARYYYRLIVTTTSGEQGWSAPTSFVVDSGKPGAAFVRGARGRLFSARGAVLARLRKRLAAFAAKAKKRPAGERYSIDLTLRAYTTSTARQRLHKAVRVTKLKAQLAKLGMTEQRYDLAVRVVTRGVSALHIAAVPAPPASAVKAQLLVDGVRRPVSGAVASVPLSFTAGKKVDVDITLAGGRRAYYHVPPPKPIAPKLRGAPIMAINTVKVPVAKSRVPVRSPDPVTAGRITLYLPKAGTELKTRELTVSGKTVPGNRVVIGDKNKQTVHVAGDGSFSASVTLPVGKSTLKVRSFDAHGNRAEVDWPVKVADQHVFVMALGEATAGSAYTSDGFNADRAWLPGMTEDSSVALGPLRLHGRAAAYVKARVRGGDVFDSVNITAHVDTAKPQGSGALFTQIVDPVRDFAVYGDSAKEVADVNTRGKLYVRVEADKSKAIIGSFHTRMRGGQLFAYDRTVDGAMVHARRDVAKAHLNVRAFGTTDTGQLSRDINLYRATGGSLYYLRHGSVIEGSERVVVITRDRDTGVVVGQRELVRNRDYTIDYAGGRVLLVQPVASQANDSWVMDNFDSSLTPGGGHPVYVKVRYEHSDLRSSGQRAGGVRVQGTYERVSIGAGVVAEDRDASTYSLWGADVDVRLGKRSKLHAEIAGSRDRDAANVLSMDGGMTFGNMNNLADAADPTGNELQLGWKLSGDVHVSDFVTSGPLSRVRVLAFAQQLDRGFSAGDTLPEQGRLKLGALVSYRLSKTDQLKLRHIAEVAEVPRLGPTAADVAANPDPLRLDERATHLTSLQWSRDQGRWHYRAEGAFHRLTTTAALADGSPSLEANRLGAGVMAAYDYTKHLRLRAGQQVVVGLGDADPLLKPIDPMTSTVRNDEALAGVTTNVGADWKLTPSATLSGDWYQRWNGDNAAQVGLTSSLSDSGRMYVRERVHSYQGHAISTTIIGASDRLGNTGARTYGEYQLENGILGQRNRAVLGVAHRWYARPDLRIALGFEHQQIFGGFLPDGTPVGDNQRNVGYAAAELRRDRLRLTGQVQVRVDNGLGGDALTALIAQDPRPTANATDFADHGGTAPGAPVVLSEGDLVQLIGSVGAAYKASRDHTGLVRVRLSNTLTRLAGGDDFDDRAHFLEASVGWAYRPRHHDWLQMLARYSYLRDQRPLSALGDGSDGQSHVVAVIPMARLPHDLRLSGKLAIKRTEAVAIVADIEEIDASNTALLWIARLGYELYGKWDITGELRQLVMWKSVGRESQIGTLLELGYRLNDWVRLGIGYNLSHFSDNELADLERDGHGFFVRVTGQY